jgi:hypothetical protein
MYSFVAAYLLGVVAAAGVMRPRCRENCPPYYENAGVRRPARDAKYQKGSRMQAPITWRRKLV